MANTVEEIIKIKVDNKQAQKAFADQLKETERLKAEIKDLDKTSEDYYEQLADLQIQLEKSRKKQREYKKETQLTANSQQALRNEVAKLRDEQVNLDFTTAEGKKRFEELEETLKSYQETLKNADQESGFFQSTIGRYREEVGKAIEENLGFQFSIKGIGNAIKANPIGALIAVFAALVAAGKALFDVFKSTERGSRMLAEASAFLSGAFGVVTKAVNDLIPLLIGVFTDPVGAIKAFGQALTQNIINRFTAILDLVQAAATGLNALWNRDLKGVEKAAKDAGTALIQMGTGLDADQQQEFADSVRDTVKQVGELGALAVRIDKLTFAFERLEAQTNTALASLRQEAELLEAIADDNTKTLAERNEASLKAAQVQEEIARKQRDIASRQLEIERQKVELARRSGKVDQEQLIALQQARQAAIESETEYQLTRQRLARQSAEIIRDTREKELDFLIDNFDSQKTEIERLFNAEETTNLEREKLLEELTKKTAENYAQQNDIINEFAEAKLDLNELIAIDDTKQLNERLKQYDLDEIEMTRVLEVIRERRTVAQDLADLEADLAKKRKEEAKETADVEVEENQNAVESLKERHKKEVESIESQAEKLNKLKEHQKTLEEERDKASAAGQTERAKDLSRALIQNAKEQAEAEEKIEKRKMEVKKASMAAIATIAQQGQQLAAEGTVAAKAFAVTDATLNTYQAANQVIADPLLPTFLKVPAAGLIIANGLKNVQQIVETDVPGFATGGVVGAANMPARANGDNVLATLQTGEVVFRQDQLSALAGAFQANQSSSFGINSAGNNLNLGGNIQSPNKSLNSGGKALDQTEFAERQRRLQIEQIITKG